MPINPRFQSLYDLSPPREQGTFRGMFGIGSFDPGKESHAPQLKSIEQGIMTGIYSDDDIAAFAQRNPQTTPFLQQAMQKRDIYKKHFQPGVPASPELAEPIRGFYAGQQATGQPGPIAEEAASLAQLGREPVNDIPGAINSLLAAGKTDEAIKVASLQKDRSGKQPNALKFAIRAEGYHPDTPLEDLPPKVAERALARTMTPVAVSTGLGTNIFSRGGVPGETIPGFIPKVDRPPASVKEAITSNESKIRKISDALIATDPKATTEQKKYLASKRIVHDPKATGLQGFLPNVVLNRVDPSGVDVRGLIADLGSMEIRDRSGAAVTAAELPRLAPFIPNEKDDPSAVRKKLFGFKNALTELNKDIRAGYTFEQGFVPPPEGRGSAQQPPTAPPDSTRQIPSGWSVRQK